MAPELDAPSATGEALRLADHRGRWTALYFWASWCGNCAAQAPQLAELRKLYPAVDVIGVSFDSDRREMERFRATYSETWPTTFSGRMLWEDPAGKRYRIKGPGVICLIDPRGVLDGTYGSIGDVMARVSGNPVGVAGRWQSAAGSNKEVKHEP
jgi:thiol-disulfide isomerase/thioredoxin